jgi:hypothetical protein
LTPWSILHHKVLLFTNLGRLPGVFTTGESQLPGDEYSGESRLSGDEYTGESQLPGTEYTRESITNSNNSSNIRKNLKFFLGVYNGNRRRCLMEKNIVKKSRDTVPLSRSKKNPNGKICRFEYASVKFLYKLIYLHALIPKYLFVKWAAFCYIFKQSISSSIVTFANSAI